MLPDVAGVAGGERDFVLIFTVLIGGEKAVAYAGYCVGFVFVILLLRRGG